MNIPFPVAFILMGVLGLILSTILILQSLKKKAKSANVIFTVSGYFRDDWFTPVGSVISIMMAYILMPYAPEGWSDGVQLVVSAAIGYLGSDIPSRVFSVVSKRINAAIDYKTTIADTQTGNLDAPTPAAKPEKSPNP